MLPVFDIRTIPFSRRGSWLNLSPVVGLHDARPDIHLVSHQTGMHAILRFEVRADGPAEVVAGPSCLSWTSGTGSMDAVFDTREAVRLRGQGLGLTLHDAASGLTPFTGTYLFTDPIDGAAVFTSYETGRRYRVTVLAGVVSVAGDQALGAGTRAVVIDPAADGTWEAVIEEFDTARASYVADVSFDERVAEVAEEFTRYVDDIAPWREPGDAAALAAYVLWSATVAPRGFLRRESVLMSKHWMDKVWSWDHCFNALALAAGLPQEALDQFLVVFDQQDELGGLPDSVTHSEVLDNFVKPPIHGWAFAQLRARLGAPLDRQRLEEVYGRLSRWTGFWLDHRRVPGHPLPHYQHGNDSGWDNSTMFDNDRVVEAPDLAAFLLIQLGVVADLADELGHDAAHWRREQAAIAEALSGLFAGDAFAAEHPLTGRRSTTTSLLNLMPVVAADFLAADVTDALAGSISWHLTDWGVATERPDSGHYEDDGYWRGPIWAPSTVLIEYGLRRAGRTDLADDIRERFCRLCERSGFAENFDARSGAGLRDRAYTWTASAYLLFRAEIAAPRP